MRADVLEALQRLRDKHGLSQEVIDGFVAIADTTNRGIEDEALITREQDPAETDQEPEVQDDAQEEQPKPETQEQEAEEPNGDLEVELDEDAVDAIVDRVAEAQFFVESQSRVDAIQATITELVERMVAAERRAQEAEARLAELERDDEDKQREWLADQPRRRTLRVSHRPREANRLEKNPGEPAEGTLADEAEATLSRMPRY